jgi:GTPase SAR1 family protein
MNRGDFARALARLPANASVIFAVRAGLRMLPWLAQSRENQVFGRWDEIDRPGHLLAVFCAYDLGLMATLNATAPALIHVAQQRRSAAATAAVAAYPADAAACADAAYTIDAATYAATDGSQSGAAAAAAYAADAAVYAANTYAITGIIREVDVELTRDLTFIIKFGARNILNQPLWQKNIPAQWAKQLTHFKTAALALNCRFEFWLNWYDERVKGNIIDGELLQARVFLPEAVSTQSPLQINSYLASLAENSVAGPLNRVRAIFIGDGEAGKTSLIRVLHDEPVVEGIEPKTPGIDIREWQVPKTAIKASFWDFGGQIMVHATHQLFLRESCLYILLVSAREKEKATERAEYWLAHVKSFGRGAPVLIVANKADKEPVRLDEALLQEKYPGMIKGFFQLACTEAKSTFRNQFEQFREAFCDQLQNVGLHQVRFQSSHFKVLQNLRQRTPSEAFLTQRAYTILCQQQGIKESEPLNSEWLLDILDKLGVIVHFPAMPEMGEYILNPRWLTYGVYTVMYHEQAKLTKKQIIELLARTPIYDQDGTHLSYPPERCKIVWDSMRQYKLAYFLPRNLDQLIIPALLPSDLKQHGFDTVHALEFRFEFESFLPRHLISELIVECHEDIVSNGEQDIVWQHGALLENNTHRTRALIQADYHFRRLTIWLSQGAAAGDFLAVLRDKVGNIVKRIDIRYQQNIRLPDDARINQAALITEQEWADFEQILALRDNGDEFYTHKSRTKYSIARILGLFMPQPTPIHLNVTGQIGTVNLSTGDYSPNQTHPINTTQQEQKMGQTTTITGSTIHGNVVTAKTIKNSFNQVQSAALPDELKTALADFLQELERLQQSATPEQKAAVDKTVKLANRLAEDSADAQNDPKWYEVSLPGLWEATKAVAAFAPKALALLGQVKSALPL